MADTLKFGTASPQIQQWVQQAAAAAGVSPFVLASVMQNESNFNPKVADGPKETGEIGIMQLTRDTRNRMGITDTQARDTRTNIYLGALWLAQKIKENGGDVSRGVAAYNGTGPQAEAYAQAAMGRLRLPSGMDLSRVQAIPPGYNIAMNKEGTSFNLIQVPPTSATKSPQAQPPSAQQTGGFMRAAGEDITSLAKGLSGMPGQMIGSLPGLNLLPAAARAKINQFVGGLPGVNRLPESLRSLPLQQDPVAMTNQMAQHWQQQKQAGYPAWYRALTPTAEAVGTNVRGMEQSAQQGDFSGVLGHAAVPVATTLAATGLAEAAGRFSPAGRYSRDYAQGQEIAQRLAQGEAPATPAVEGEVTTAQRLRKFPAQYAKQKIVKKMPGYDIKRAWQGTAPKQRAVVAQAAPKAGAVPSGINQSRAMASQFMPEYTREMAPGPSSPWSPEIVAIRAQRPGLMLPGQVDPAAHLGQIPYGGAPPQIGGALAQGPTGLPSNAFGPSRTLPGAISPEYTREMLPGPSSPWSPEIAKIRAQRPGLMLPGQVEAPRPLAPRGTRTVLLPEEFAQEDILDPQIAAKARKQGMKYAAREKLTPAERRELKRRGIIP